MLSRGYLQIHSRGYLQIHSRGYLQIHSRGYLKIHLMIYLQINGRIFTDAGYRRKPLSRSALVFNFRALKCRIVLLPQPIK